MSIHCLCILWMSVGDLSCLSLMFCHLADVASFSTPGLIKLLFNWLVFRQLHPPAPHLVCLWPLIQAQVSEGVQAEVSLPLSVGEPAGRRLPASAGFPRASGGVPVGFPLPLAVPLVFQVPLSIPILDGAEVRRTLTWPRRNNKPRRLRHFRILTRTRYWVGLLIFEWE